MNMTTYNIEPKDIKHPVTGDVVGTAVTVDVAAIVEPDENGNSRAKGFYNLKNDTGTTIPFGYHNIHLSIDGWSGDMGELETQVLTALGVTTT